MYYATFLFFYFELDFHIFCAFDNWKMSIWHLQLDFNIIIIMFIYCLCNQNLLTNNYIYKTECVCVCVSVCLSVCSTLQNLFFRLFLKFLCHLIVKTEFKYFLQFLSYRCLKLRSGKKLCLKTSNFYIWKQILITYLNSMIL